MQPLDSTRISSEAGPPNIDVIPLLPEKASRETAEAAMSIAVIAETKALHSAVVSFPAGARSINPFLEKHLNQSGLTPLLTLACIDFYYPQFEGNIPIYGANLDFDNQTQSELEALLQAKDSEAQFCAFIVLRYLNRLKENIHEADHFPNHAAIHFLEALSDEEKTENFFLDWLINYYIETRYDEATDTAARAKRIDEFEVIPSDAMPIPLDRQTTGAMLLWVEDFYGVNLSDLEPRHTLYFIRFLTKADRQEVSQLLDKVRSLDQGLKINALKCYVYCYPDKALGQELINLATDHKRTAVFQQAAKILDLITFDPNSAVRHNILFRRLRDFIRKSKTREITQLHQLIKTFPVETLAWGIDFVEILRSGKNQYIDPNFLESIGIGRVQDFTGLPDTVTIDDHGAITHFNDPEFYSAHDHEMLTGCIRNAYADKDEAWGEKLIRDLAKDLNNPAVKFNFLRDHEGKIIGTIKTRPATEAERKAVDPYNQFPDREIIYRGTLYVAPGYERDFAVGQYMRWLTTQQYPKDTIFLGHIAVNNLNLPLSVERAQGLVVDLTTETDDQGPESKPLAQVAYNHPLYSYAKTRDLSVPEIYKLTETDDHVLIYPANTEFGQDQFFIENCNRLLPAGFVLTRLIYPNDTKMKQGHVVFEKIQLPVDSSSDDLDSLGALAGSSTKL